MLHCFVASLQQTRFCCSTSLRRWWSQPPSCRSCDSRLKGCSLWEVSCAPSDCQRYCADLFSRLTLSFAAPTAPAFLFSDPKQLPPTLPGHDEGIEAQSQSVGEREEFTGLARTLFVRMKDAGMDSMMLRTQYRSAHKNIARPSTPCYVLLLLTRVTCCLQLPPASE